MLCAELPINAMYHVDFSFHVASCQVGFIMCVYILIILILFMCYDVIIIVIFIMWIDGSL